jgi:hypothetical protein
MCGNGYCEAAEDADSCAQDCDPPKGCTGPEAYVYFDLVSRGLVDRREAMRVSWYANAGVFADDRTGRTEAEMEVTSDNTWTAPNESRVVTLWVVLRDSRGGLGWKAYRVTVQ